MICLKGWLLWGIDSTPQEPSLGVTEGCYYYGCALEHPGETSIGHFGPQFGVPVVVLAVGDACLEWIAPTGN